MNTVHLVTAILSGLLVIDALLIMALSYRKNKGEFFGWLCVAILASSDCVSAIIKLQS